MRRVEGILKKIDWLLVAFILPIVFASLFTMKNFSVLEASNTFFEKQMIWLSIGFAIFFLSSFFDFRFLKQTNILVALFLFNSFLLLLLFILGHVSHGAKSWFNFGFFSFQPVDTMKLILILILSKYFSRRHVEIGDIKHIFISGFYAFVPFVLVLMQPDFGSAMIIGLIWLGMVMVSGISKTHLFVVFGLGILTFLAFWFLLFAPYQKARIMNFIDPLSDIHGTGYNAFQSTIAVGSGQVLGKGLGFGTQSRLKFLPQPQSDFIFASFFFAFPPLTFKTLVGSIALAVSFVMLSSSW
jgi:rod shape determining protein RodA